MNMTNNITKASLKTLLEDINFEADNDEETIYKLAIKEDKNYSGLSDMLTITVYFDYKFPRNKFKLNKDKNKDNSYIRIFCWFATYDDKLGKFTKNYADTLYTKDSKGIVEFLEEYIGEIKKKGASDSERQ